MFKVLLIGRYSLRKREAQDFEAIFKIHISQKTLVFHNTHTHIVTI